MELQFIEVWRCSDEAGTNEEMKWWKKKLQENCFAVSSWKKNGARIFFVAFSQRKNPKHQEGTPICPIFTIFVWMTGFLRSLEKKVTKKRSQKNVSASKMYTNVYCKLIRNILYICLNACMCQINMYIVHVYQSRLPSSPPKKPPDLEIWRIVLETGDANLKRPGKNTTTQQQAKRMWQKDWHYFYLENIWQLFSC